MQPRQRMWLQMCEKALQMNTDNRDLFNNLIALLAEMPRGGLQKDKWNKCGCQSFTRKWQKQLILPDYW